MIKQQVDVGGTHGVMDSQINPFTLTGQLVRGARGPSEEVEWSIAGN